MHLSRLCIALLSSYAYLVQKVIGHSTRGHHAGSCPNKFGLVFVIKSVLPVFVPPQL